MEELINVLLEIRDLLSDINFKLDDIRGCGTCSMDDIYNKLNDITGLGLHSLDDVYDKINLIR